jgi:hypothetical protein
MKEGRKEGRLYEGRKEVKGGRKEGRKTCLAFVLDGLDLRSLSLHHECLALFLP